MKRRVTYYASRKNVLTWIAVFLSVCAGACYIANVTCMKGAGVSGVMVWFRAVLPVAAAFIFALVVALRSEDRLYRIAIPWWMLMISLGFCVLTAGLAWYWCVLGIVILLALAVLGSKILSGSIPADWLLILLAGLPLSSLILYNGEALFAPLRFAALLPLFSDGLLLLAYIALCFAMKEQPEDGTYHPTWGDREDGRRVRSLSPITVVASYIMPNRNGASNKFKSSIEITALEKYIRQKKLEGYEGFGITEIFIAAYVHTVAKYPALNRFLSGQKIYSRDEDIQLCMVIKKEMTTEAPDTIIKLHLNPHDSIKEVYEKFHTAVMEVHKSDALDSEFDGTAKLLGSIPGVVLKFAIWLLKLLDYFGLIPRFLLEVSPFHGSIFFTSMGSLGIPPIYHHLYDFGNLPIFCAFGCKRRESELQDDGTVSNRKYIDYSIVMDERITDGFYYAAAFKHFQRLLQNPERLDTAPEKVLHDIP